MWLRPWHVIVCVLTLSTGLIVASYFVGDRAHEFTLGLGINLLSSVVIFLLLELYWDRVRLVNGKEVDGFDYSTFARNIERSRRVRLLATFIYPLTDHPNYADERQELLAAIRTAAGQPGFLGLQILVLNPESSAARQRAEERKDDAIIKRIGEAVGTLSGLLKELGSAPAGERVEVRLYARTPPFALFQTDNFASISFYYRDRPISEVARYEFFTDSPIGGFVEKTFDDLWHDERTVPLTEYVRTASQSTGHPDA
jgi:hypothetical protein